MPVAGLTPILRATAMRLYAGDTVAAIAQARGRSPATVKRQCARLRQITCSQTTVQAVARLVKVGEL